MRFALILVCALVLGSCSHRLAPSELGGLWGRSAAACEAGAGVIFGPRAVSLVLGGHAETLLADPQYAVSRSGSRLRFAITYALSSDLGSKHIREGEVVLELREDAWLHPVARQFSDAVTGSVRVPLRDATGLMRVLKVARCEDLAPQTAVVAD